MAERSSKTGSRRTTPQPATVNRGNAPINNRQTRVTRSQSRNLSDDESEKDARRHRKKAQNSRTSEDHSRVPGKGLPKSTEINPDLSMVEEEIYPQLPASSVNDAPASTSKSPGETSQFSGTTARTSRNAQDLENIISRSGAEKERKRHSLGKFQSEAFKPESPRAQKIAALTKRKATQHAVVRASTEESGKRGRHETQRDEIQVQSTAPAVMHRLASPGNNSGDHSNTQNPTVSDYNQAQPPLQDEWQPPLNDSDDEEVAFQTQVYPVSVTSNVLRISSQQLAESNKENEMQSSAIRSPERRKMRLIDPQPGAQRVEWGSQGDFETLEEFSSRSRERVPRQDVHTLVRKRPSPEVSSPQQNLPKRNRVEESPRRSQERAHSEILPTRPLQERAQERTGQSSQAYLAANRHAKERTAYAPKRVQSRIPWSEAEIGRLIDLIEEHGISYSKIKKCDDQHTEGGLLGNRDQVALKDKAQNMKFDFLKAGRHMPTNFDLIPLRNILVEKLLAQGVIYDKETGMREDAVS